MEIADQYEFETIEIVNRLKRPATEPTSDSELLGDLGLDSYEVLELVGELEDRYDIAVSLNSLSHIKTVGQIASEVRRLVAEQGENRDQ